MNEIGESGFIGNYQMSSLLASSYASAIYKPVRRFVIYLTNRAFIPSLYY